MESLSRRSEESVTGSEATNHENEAKDIKQHGIHRSCSCADHDNAYWNVYILSLYGTDKTGMKDEAAYLAASLNFEDQQNLDKYKNITITRITRIAKDGTVIYDSSGKEKSMGNHKNRTEVKEAFKHGHGEDTRMSMTLRKQTYYYALKLKDGTILRMSRETQTIVRQMEDIIPIIALILAVVTILSVILSRMSTDRIVEPINQINLIHPKQNKTYSELTPLLDKIENRIWI